MWEVSCVVFILLRTFSAEIVHCRVAAGGDPSMDNDMIIQLLVFSAEAILVALLVLGLFRIRTRFGLSPLFVTLGVYQSIQVLLASSVYAKVIPGVVVSPGSTIMFMASLFAMLLVYIREDASETRKAICGILLANLTMTLLLYVAYGMRLDLVDTLNFLSLPREVLNQNARVMLAGTLALFADVLLTVFVYEAVCRFISKSLFLRVYLTMAFILSFDSLIFASGAFWGQPNFASILTSGIIGKLGMAVFFSAALTVYLRFAEPLEPKSLPIQDVYHALTYRQEYELTSQKTRKIQQESEERFRVIFHGVNDVIVVHDAATGAFLDVNQRMSELYGYSRAEAMQLRIDEISSGEPGYTQEDAVEWMRKALAGQPQLFSWQAKHKDGTLFWVEVNMRAAQFGGEERIIVVARDITERKQAESALSQRAREFTALYETASSLVEKQDMSNRLELIADRAAELLDSSLGFVYLLDPESDDLILMVAKDSPIPIGTRVHMGEGMAGRVARSLQPAIVDDLRAWEGRLPQFQYAQVSAVVEVPLIHSGELIGVLGVREVGDTTRKYTEKDVHLLSLFAAQAASAVQNTRLLERFEHYSAELEARVAERTAELERLNRRDEALADINVAISQPFELQGVLEEIAALTGQFLPADAASVLLWDDSTAHFSISASTVPGQHAGMGAQRVRRSDGASRWIVDSQQPLVVPDIRDDPFEANRMLGEHALQAYVGVPLVFEGRSLGVLYALEKEPRQFSDRDLEFMQDLASRASIAVNKVRVYEQLAATNLLLEQRGAELNTLYLRQAALAAVELSINQPHDLQNVLEEIVAKTTALLPASLGASITLWDAQQERFYVSATTVPKLEASSFTDKTRSSGGVTRWILETGQIYVVRDINEDRYRKGRMMPDHGVRAYVGVPILDRGIGLGVLFAFDNHVREYSNDELDFLTSLSGRAASAIVNVRAYEEIQIAKESAQSADHLKSIFLASMSHELRTPLNSIIGFTGILLQEMSGKLNDEQRKQLAFVQTSGRHLLELINDVLDISKIEAGEVSLVLDEFELMDLVREVADTFSPAVAEKGLQLITDVPSLAITSDKRRVKQVLMNLVSNAVKFTDHGLVSIMGEILETQTLEMRVRDTGVGMTENEMERLFYPFQQIDDRLTRRFEGTGLGLYLSKTLLALLGGSISVNSRRGEGSEFTFTLPLRGGKEAE